MAELAEAQAEASMARAAEEANGLTLLALQARHKELENAITHAKESSKKQAERLDAQVVEVGGKNTFCGVLELKRRTFLIDEKNFNTYICMCVCLRCLILFHRYLCPTRKHRENTECVMY